MISLTTYTAHAITILGDNLQYEMSGGFQPYRGDIKHFETLADAVYESAKEANQYNSIRNVTIDSHTFDPATGEVETVTATTMEFNQ